MSRQLQYIEKVDIYPSSGMITYNVDDQTVNYVVPVCPGSTYKVVMTEIGNRLRSVFTTSNPLTMTASISDCTDIVMNPTFDVGYEFSYTPTDYGYMVVYVSNVGEHPTISIETNGAGGDDKYTIMCNQAISDTTLTGSIYAKAGDWVFCTLTTRSETTLPDDWTVLHISQTITSGTQHMTLLCKEVTEDGMIDFTAIQSSSARIYISLIAFSGIMGFRYHNGEYFYDADSYDSFTVKRPVYKTVLWAMSSNIWSTSGPYSPWVCNEIDNPVITLPSTTQRRQANFIDENTGSERTFTPASAGTSAIILWVEVITGEYVSSGYAEFSTTDIRVISSVKTSFVTWDADTPSGTAINVYSKLSNGEYVICEKDGSISSLSTGDNLSAETLYFKVEMTTEDPTVSPVFRNIHIQILDQSDENVIVLCFKSGNVNSIQNAVGDVTIAYDGSGTLTGLGGPVLAFEKTFLPVDLNPKNSPNDEEHIEVTDIKATSNLMRIFHTNTSCTEHIEITEVSATAALTNISDI